MIYECFLCMLFVFGIAGWGLPQKINNNLFVVAITFMAVIVCLRNVSVGFDTVSYVGFFSGKGGLYGIYSNPGHEVEKGISILGYIYHFIGIKTTEEWPYLMINGILTVAPLFLITKRFSVNPCFSLFLMFTALRGSFMILYVAALRQALSIAFTLFSLYFIVEKPNKYKLYFILLSAASVLFHNTGILMTIVILVMNYLRPSKKVAYSLLSGIFVISLFFNSVGLNLFSQLLASLNSLTAARYDYYSSSESYDLSERSVLSIGLNLILPYIFVYLSSDEELQKNIFLKTYILAPCVFLLFGSFEQVSRMVAGIWIIGAVGALPSQDVIRKSNLFLLVVVVSVFFLSRAIFMYSGKGGVVNGFMPYNFFWE